MTVQRQHSAIVFVATLMVGWLGIAGGVFPACAQVATSRSSFISPFPKGDVYRLHVVGDWYADGFHKALVQAFASHRRVRVESNVSEVNTLRRNNWDLAVSRLEELTKVKTVDIAVVMFGASEIGSLRMPGRRRFRFGSDEWKIQYAVRIDRMMQALKARSSAVYWLGLPVVRRSGDNENYQEISKIFRERAYANGVKYVDVYAGFTDGNGDYSSYGPDIDGKIRLLRSRDGRYFTTAGNRKLAHFAEREIRRDLSRAQMARTVPLAGSELEQRRINPERAINANPRTAGHIARSKLRKGRTAKPGFSRRRSRVGARVDGLKADDGKVVISAMRGRKQGVVLKFKIVRPAISAEVVDIVTRKQSADRPAQLGDNVAYQVAGDVTMLSSVTPANPSIVGGLRRKLSPTQSPFFKVWAKGERLMPRKGRADDIVWPRPEPIPVVRVVVKRAPVKLLPAWSDERVDDGFPPLPVPNPLGMARHRARR